VTAGINLVRPEVTDANFPHVAIANREGLTSPRGDALFAYAAHRAYDSNTTKRGAFTTSNLRL